MSEETQFMNFLNNPSEVVNTTGFRIASAAIKFTGMIIFAVVGTTISGFKFSNLRDALEIAFWISFAVLLAEQIYAASIGFDLGRFLFFKANKKAQEALETSEDYIEGIVDDEGKVILKGIVYDQTEAIQAIDEINKEDKIALIKKRMEELIGIFESKRSLYESNKKNFWLIPKAMRITKKKFKLFFRKKTAVEYCEKQIGYGEKMLENERAILQVPNKNVQNFTELTYEDLVSNSEEFSQATESRHHMRSEKKRKQKNQVKKAFFKLASSLLGPAILWGTLKDVEGSYIAYTVFMMFIQFLMGVKESKDIVDNILVINETRRAKAIKTIHSKIPKIKEANKEAELKRLAEEKKQAEAKRIQEAQSGNANDNKKQPEEKPAEERRAELKLNPTN